MEIKRKVYVGKRREFMGKGKLLRKGMAMLLAVVMIIGFLPGVGSLEVSAEEGSMSETTITPSAPKKGDGTADNPYQIGSAAELYWFADKVNKGNTGACAELTANITVNTDVLNENGEPASGDTNNDTSQYIKWTSIGTEDNAFTGTFDGQGCTISGLYFNDAQVDYVGLFGCVKSGGKVENVGVKDSYFMGFQAVGGVCGHIEGTEDATAIIEGCYNTGTVSGTVCVGGVCGETDKQYTIKNCYNTGSVSGKTSDVGGVCGRAVGEESTIENCYNTGDVEGTSGIIGGICGQTSIQVTIKSCYNTGAVSGLNFVGGVCGGTANIENCYNTGAVSGSELVGGICGTVSIIKNCYNTGAVSGSELVGGICGNVSTITNCYNIGAVNGSKDVGGICGVNSDDSDDSITNCYYDSTVYTGNDTNAIGKTTEQFASGEVAYLLQEGQGNQADVVWGQTLTGENKQASPVLGGKEVYKVKRYLGCEDAQGELTDGYSNTEGDIIYEPHRYENGICIFCQKAYQEAVLTKYDINGDGQEEDVYEISNAGQLYWFADKVNKVVEGWNISANAVLTADIIVNKNVLKSDGAVQDGTFKDWEPIGGKYSYTGTFDGQNHTVSGLYFNDETAKNVGLFGWVESGGEVVNVGILDSYFSGNCWIGGICGNNNGMIENCYNEGSVSGSQAVGGVCGYNEGTCKNSYNTGAVSGSGEQGCVGGVCGAVNSQSITTNCYNTGAVNGSQFVGGVCGCVMGVGNTIKNCYNTGIVKGTSVYVGGVCGAVNSQDTVTNCYNIGAVNGSEYVGGVCGGNSIGTTTNCYNIGTVNGSEQVGGICGYNIQGTITNCYYDSTVYNGKMIGEDEGGITSKIDGKTTDEFKSGAVTYLLQKNQKDQEDQTEPVWGQTLAGDNKQDSPVLGGERVYKVKRYLGCEDAQGELTDGYSNSNEKIFEPHKDDGSQDGTAYDNRCDFCGKELHSFNEDGSCKDADCVYHKGSITNVSCPTKIVYSGDVANVEPKVSDFTVNSGQALTFKWYPGDVTNGNLPTDSLGATTPKEAGIYTLVVKADGAEKGGIVYTVAELRVKVAIEKEQVKEQPTTPQPSDTTTAQQPSGTNTTQQPSGTTEVQPTEGLTVSQPPKNGEVVTDDKTKAKFEVTDVSKKEVTYNAPADEKEKDITVPNTVTINGEVYKVTKIADNAFKGNKTVTNIMIGSNVKTIGKNAFKGCKKLKTITIQSKTLTNKKISKKAFKGISKKTVIKVPKKRLATYKKMFKKKGLSSKNKVKGY